MAGVTPVTLLAGIAGTGKTTLLARALADARFRDTAVIVEGEGEPEARARGCICCRMAGGLVRTLRELHVARLERRIPDFARVVVEASGLGDLGALLGSLDALPVVASRYALGAVATVVDARGGLQALDRHREARVQVAVADRLVLSKMDIQGALPREALAGRLGELNPTAPIIEATDDPAAWLEAGLQRGRGRPPSAQGWLAGGDERLRPVARAAAALRTRTWRHPEPLPWPDVERALADMVATLGARLLRLKGLVEVAGEAGPRAVHAAGHTLYPPTRLERWPGERRGTTLVFVTEGVEDGEFARILPVFPTSNS